jgi:amidohydrolase
MFSLTIRGKGGHGGFPHETTDPIAITSQVITNLQHIVARQIDPLQSVVVSTTRIAGGTADNIIPGSVDLGGTVRTFSASTRASTRAALERVIEGVTGAHGATATFDYRVGYDAVVNDAAVAAVVADAIRAELGTDGLADIPPIMGGDDFSAYLQHTPGAYFFVGTRSETAESTFQHHHARFTLDERSLRTAVGVFLRSVATLLHRAPLEGG